MILVQSAFIVIIALNNLRNMTFYCILWIFLKTMYYKFILMISDTLTLYDLLYKVKCLLTNSS